MSLGNIDFYLVFDLFLLLLIGMGPKIALVPFLELTEGMEAETQKRVANHMVKTALGTALLLVVLGWFLMRLLHFTPGAANVAGGIILLLLALNMMISPAKKTNHHEKATDRDILQMAIYPLAVPYLLNPAGIATLVIASSDIDSIIFGAIVIGLVLLVGAIDFAVFRNMDKLAKHLDPSRLVITEVVFGVLLAALAIQLMVDGLAELGVVSVVAH
jgi:multiple antibiotic resistance protein